MRVLAALPLYPPHSRVGAWLATHELLVGLVAAGHQVTAMPITGGHEPYEHDGITVIPFLRGRDMERAAAVADVVISHAGDNGVPAAIAARADVPNVRMVHGHLNDPTVLDGAALVVFNSHTLAATVDINAPWIVCHPPVWADRHRTTPGDRCTLVNLAEAKGGELFWRLVRCAPHRQFLGVRGGYGNQYISHAANATVIDTTNDMRAHVWAHTRILLAPSERETWGMAAVEAIASGIPVIAHPTDGLTESLAYAGLFVDRNDGQGWLDAIERLHDPTEWAAASTRALARSSALDPTTDIDRFVNHIESLRCTGART